MKYLLMVRAQDFRTSIDLKCDCKLLTYPNLLCTYSSHSIFFIFRAFQPTVVWARYSSNNGYFSFFITVIFLPFLTLNSFADQEHSWIIFLRFIVFSFISHNQSAILLFLLKLLDWWAYPFLDPFIQKDWHIYFWYFIDCSWSSDSTKIIKLFTFL